MADENTEQTQPITSDRPQVTAPMGVTASPQPVVEDKSAITEHPSILDGERTQAASERGSLSQREDYTKRSEVQQFLGWVAGFVLILVCGWGLLLVAFFLTRSWDTQEPEIAYAVFSVLSLVLFQLLERDYWLSRLMGLRINTDFPPWASAVLFWLLGIPLLLFRSTLPRTKPAPLPEAETQVEPVSKTTHTSREIIETVVFVTVLWLLWKMFAFEPFVIPTGSMAESLYGYQKQVTCPQCGHEFPVNCSDEVEEKIPVVACTCPNCLYPIRFETEGMKLPCTSGDRVLVAKFVYENPLQGSRRFDVAVFKFPGVLLDGSDGPQKKCVPVNYIKRLVGLPDETVGIYYGDLYRAEGIAYDPAAEKGQGPLRKQMHKNNDEAVRLLRAGRFEMIRKPPDKILALQRSVYDNDHQARDLIKEGHPPRWAPETDDPNRTAEEYFEKRKRAENGAWRADDPNEPKRFHHAARPGDDLAWLRYRHVLRGSSKPTLITDTLGYNNGEPRKGYTSPNWVGDLILECEVIVEKPEGELVLELSKGIDRFQAQWDLGTGVCTLWRLTGATEPKKLQSTPTPLKKGTYQLRFANVDQRLTLWVDGSRPFDDGVAYETPAERGPFANDLQPASVGVRGGAVSVQKLKLWRDTYYTTGESAADLDLGDAEAWGDPNRWDKLRRDMPAATFYVQPGHYLCLGDNSSRSSDGRTWGLVPENLMLGRALVVFYPFPRVQLIR